MNSELMIAISLLLRKTHYSTFQSFSKAQQLQLDMHQLLLFFVVLYRLRREVDSRLYLLDREHLQAIAVQE